MHHLRKASSTIEMALLLPVLLTVLTAIWYLGIYIYDKGILNLYAYEAVLEGSSDLYQTEQEAYEAAQEVILHFSKQKLLSIKELTSQITLANGGIQVTYEATLYVPLGTFFEPKITVQKESARYRPIKRQKIGVNHERME